MHSESWIQQALNMLEDSHLKRELAVFPDVGGKFEINGRRILNFSSNDYLDLANRPEVGAAARNASETYGSGTGASRLVSGSLALHEELEHKIATHKDYPASLIFGSGFLTNIGVIPALAGRNDVVFADKLVHASIIDAILLSRARLVRFHHNDSERLATQLQKQRGTGRRLIVTESVFSMDGDLAPLPEITALAAEHDAMLMVDEAHASGVFGPCGAGLVREHQLQKQVNICMGTFSKALGNYGGFAACSTTMKEWLINRARSFIYTTALPPPVIGGCLKAIDILEREPGLGAELQRRSAYFRELLAAQGFDTGQSQSQIIPVMLGESKAALRLSKALKERGILGVAIRPPTVPQGSARLRLSVTLAHTKEDLKHAANILGELA